MEYQGKSKGVVIPTDITVIKCGAFQNYTGLISVTIPESVTKIERSAFEGCTSLTSVVILEGVNLIGGRAFCGCTSLNSITIPASVTEIGWSAFEGCTSLTSVAIPESVTEIGESAFASCSPALLAPHTPIANFAVENKPGACCGFAKLYLEHTEMDLAIQAGYLKYIRNQKKRLYTVAVHHEELLRLMIAEEMLVRKDIDLLLEECDKQNNIVARAAVLDYADENLKPVDSLGDVEKEAKTIEHRTKQIERTGQLPAKELKRIWSTQKREDSTLEITSYKGLRPMSLSPP